MAKKLDGNELLYHFFQKCWLEEDPDSAHDFIKKAIDTLGIWMHPKYYQNLPIVVPYAVRDPDCRHSGPNGADEWGTPDKNGYFRDDNSLIKGIVSSMEIKSPIKWLRGLKGTGFTASHVWREPSDYARTKILASRRPELNSFVPNLVWLPKQIAKLTDREGSFAQHYLQKLSRYIYGDLPVESKKAKFLDPIWKSLPAPKDVNGVSLPPIEAIPFFEYKISMVAMRKDKRIGAVRDACLQIAGTGIMSARTLVAERYKTGLPKVSRPHLQKLGDWLDEYLAVL